MHRFSLLTLLASTTLLGVGACASTKPVQDDAARRKMLALLMPTRIEIVEPFTRVRSFDDDSTPDGIELLLQAVNSLDNPGLTIVGDIRIELYNYVPASGNRKGARIEMWDVRLSTKKEQRTYWNRITQMYEFRLAVDADAIPAADKYVLLVTYNSPLGDNLTDECVIARRTSTRPLGSARRTGR